MIKIRDLLRLEAASGSVLVCASLMAILCVNSKWQNHYLSLLNAQVFHFPLTFWVNEGLMAIFFLLIGLELKREFLVGELTGLSKIALPGAAALGGMVVPALIYIAFNFHQAEALKGWAIPVATDIAFALGILSLFGRRIPTSLKLFLLALAVIDDLGAIIIIALFYSHDFSVIYFILGCIIFLLLCALNKVFKISVLFPYIFLGVGLWICVWRSGIHASITGVLLAMTIPLRAKSPHRVSLLEQLEVSLHPWVVFLILPLFAFFNAGLSFQGMTFATFREPLMLGIALGLFVGKQMGVLMFVWFMTRCQFAKWPKDVSRLDIYGIALLCGIGFTMSLFLGTLAFQGDQAILMEVRLGVFLGSILSALCGALILHIAILQKRKGGSPFEF